MIFRVELFIHGSNLNITLCVHSSNLLFKVKPRKIMLDGILLRNPEYCHTYAVQSSPTAEWCEC